jgi:kinesin family member 5
MSSVNVKVVVRVRPQNKIETSRGGAPCVTVNKENTEINVDDGYNAQKWTFDCVFAPNSTQPQVFEFVGAPVVDAVFQGYNGTIFAYGQTSSGKTHTMTGPDGTFSDPMQAGVIPRCIDAIFEGTYIIDGCLNCFFLQCIIVHLVYLFSYFLFFFR